MRNRLVPLALVALLAATLHAAPPATITVPAFGAAEAAKAQPIALVGPAALAVGQEGTWRLTGTPPVDLAKPLLDQLDWALGASRMYVFAMAPGQPKTPLDVRLELVIAAEGATLQPVIHYTPAAAGSHRVVVDWNHEQPQLVEALVDVGKSPDPEPNPDPNPPPPPPGERFVLVVAETATRTAGQWRAIQGLTAWLTQKGHPWRVEDPDLTDSRTKQTPDWFRGYLARIEAAKTPLPAMVVAATSPGGDANTVLAIVPLPPTAEAAVKVVQDNGG